MELTKYVKKHAAALTQLEQALNTLFNGTKIYTSIQISSDRFRSLGDDAALATQAWVGSLNKWYYLRNFADMDAMIAQIKHDVKEDRTK